MPPSEQEDLASRSDAELTARVRTSAADAELSELYRRHRVAVSSYARTCCREWHTAEELTAEAFTRTIQAVRGGHGPEQAWRPYLLAVVRRVAADWSATSRRTDLSPDFENWLTEVPGCDPVETGEERLLRLEDGNLVLQAFRSLPERWQGVLWHTLVEGESTAEVGALLGLSPSGVASLAARAREGLREAYLAVIAGFGTEGECLHYSGLLAAAVRGTGRRTSKSLQRHLAGCERCTRAMADLRRLNTQLPSALTAGVLLWGGAAYVTARAGGTHATAALTAQQAVPATGGPTGLTARAKAAGLGAGAAAAAIALAVTIGSLLPGPEDGKGHAAPPPSGPSAVMSSLVTSPSASPSASAKRRSASPTPKPAPTRPPRARQRPSPQASPAPAPSWAPEADARTRLRIAPTDTCMEIAGGTTAEGARPRQAACDGTPAQLWDLVSADAGNYYGGTRLRNVASGLCLTSSGATEDDSPVEQRPCDPDDGSQVWLQCDESSDDGVNFIDETDEMYLILDDWSDSDGTPGDTIGTSHMYVDAPSFGFRMDA
ncbi:sigma-70 family RNA polymerase sigma factor [Streptomyces actinomycinicus]|uniref:Sigma-70 family RNA polymerase sigma factor n=1 Tax=Streptomyces actinomycinicus TaxID=1695166 RepID=A0A937ESW6_9ACTN|nr:sigma-70 family RNA polymerase sigma factor [Streptomyces actinomycinicus]MBL1087571.1 sigma-70 family RNA polymerase sigma factor [Streptomyces actinomycinicus]